MTITNDDWRTDGDATETVQTATLVVLEGAVAVRNLDDGDEVRIVSGEAVNVTGRYTVTTVSATPACYVYAEAAGDVGKNDPSGSVGGVNGRGGGGGRPECSDACYAFASDAIYNVFSALFP